MIIPDTLKKAKKLFPQKEAVVCGDYRCTYEELGVRVESLSRFFLTQGIGKGGKVAILHPNCHYFLEVYYALAHLGAPAVPINYRLSAKEVAFILDDSESAFLVAAREFGPLVASALKEGGKRVQGVLWTGEGEEPPLEVKAHDYEGVIRDHWGGEVPEAEVNEDDIAQIYYTLSLIHI